MNFLQQQALRFEKVLNCEGMNHTRTLLSIIHQQLNYGLAVFTLIYMSSVHLVNSFAWSLVLLLCRGALEQATVNGVGQPFVSILQRWLLPSMLLYASNLPQGKIWMFVFVVLRTMQVRPGCLCTTRSALSGDPRIRAHCRQAHSTGTRVARPRLSHPR